MILYCMSLVSPANTTFHAYYVAMTSQIFGFNFLYGEETKSGGIAVCKSPDLRGRHRKERSRCRRPIEVVLLLR